MQKVFLFLALTSYLSNGCRSVDGNHDSSVNQVVSDSELPVKIEMDSGSKSGSLVRIPENTVNRGVVISEGIYRFISFNEIPSKFYLDNGWVRGMILRIPGNYIGANPTDVEIKWTRFAKSLLDSWMRQSAGSGEGHCRLKDRGDVFSTGLCGISVTSTITLRKLVGIFSANAVAFPTSAQVKLNFGRIAFATSTSQEVRTATNEIIDLPGNIGVQFKEDGSEGGPITLGCLTRAEMDEFTSLSDDVNNRRFIELQKRFIEHGECP